MAARGVSIARGQDKRESGREEDDRSEKGDLKCLNTLGTGKRKKERRRALRGTNSGSSGGRSDKQGGSSVTW